VQSIVAGGGLSRMPHLTHVLLRADDEAAARRFLRELASPGSDGDLRLTTVPGPGEHLDRHVALGLTHAGLRRLGVDAATLAAFPAAFREGPAVRAERTGDVGPNAPATWIEPFRPGSGDVHMVLSAWHRDGNSPPDRFDGLTTVATLSGTDIHRDGRPVEHFGFVDGITNPQFLDQRGPDHVPAGEFVLGHEGQFGNEVMRLSYPGMSRGPDGIGHDGSFVALRVMRQDVEGFERFLATADRHGLDGDTLAALLCGRRRDGVLLGATPDDPEPDFRLDPDGAACPIGSHVRRANPRAGLVVSQDHHARRLIRRGKPYTSLAGQPEQGLLGYFVCASLAAQYEAMLNDWMHGGVHHPSITGTNDPLVGLQPPGGGRFGFLHPRTGAPATVTVPQFVFTRGALYLFLPSRRALLRLATKGGRP
jgi:hypothetical protein